jgi:hypothetical protein
MGNCLKQKNTDIKHVSGVYIEYQNNDIMIVDKIPEISINHKQKNDNIIIDDKSLEASNKHKQNYNDIIVDKTVCEYIEISNAFFPCGHSKHLDGYKNICPWC